MEILGIGGWEMLVILLIMVMVAGPKRMIQWSYKLGQYVAVLRRMWGETAALIQKEFDNAGVDFKVPTQPPTPANLKKEVMRALTPVTKPIQDSLDEVKGDIASVRQATSIGGLGSWTGTSKLKSEGGTGGAANPDALPAPRPVEPTPVASSNGAAPPEPTASGGFGTWSQGGS